MAQNRLFKKEDPTKEELKKRVGVMKAISNAAYAIVLKFDADEYPLSSGTIDAIGDVLKGEIAKIFTADE